MEVIIFELLPMGFVKQLIKIIKKIGFTQKTLADDVGLRVNQVKRNEARSAQPTLDTLVKPAKKQKEAPLKNSNYSLKLNPFDEEEQKVAEMQLESLILKHNAKRAFMDN